MRWLLLKDLRILRRSPLQGTRWLPFVVICICLALSAFYELIEFWTALATGDQAEAFLGTQGDPWDTQWDMMLALIGAITALVLLGGVLVGYLSMVAVGGGHAQRTKDTLLHRRAMDPEASPADLRAVGDAGWRQGRRAARKRRRGPL